MPEDCDRRVGRRRVLGVAGAGAAAALAGCMSSESVALSDSPERATLPVDLLKNYPTLDSANSLIDQQLLWYCAAHLQYQNQLLEDIRDELKL